MPGSGNKYSDSAFGGENRPWLVMSTRHLSGDIDYTGWRQAKGRDGLWMEGTWRKPNGPHGVSWAGVMGKSWHTALKVFAHIWSLAGEEPLIKDPRWPVTLADLESHVLELESFRNSPEGCFTGRLGMDLETWVSLEILTRAVSVRGGNNIQTGEEGRGVRGGEVKTVNVDVAFKEFCFRTEKLRNKAEANRVPGRFCLPFFQMEVLQLVCRMVRMIQCKARFMTQ